MIKHKPYSDWVGVEHTGLEKLFEEVDSILQKDKTSKGLDNAFRFASALLSRCITLEWEKAGYKFKEGAVDKRLFDSEEFSQYALPWFDHHGQLIDDTGKKIATVEPYHLDQEDIEALIKYCDKNDLKFSIHSSSPHFPGMTIMVRIFKGYVEGT